MGSILFDLLAAILPLTVIVVLIMAAPAIIGSLIGQILRFFRNLFGGKDDDDE